MVFELSEKDTWFPEVSLAESDGLLALGGDLSPARLLVAYQQGIFPWYSDETPILWYSPHERFVLFPQDLVISDSMKKIMKSNFFRITFNKAFEKVISACASAPRKDQNGTWITSEMQAAYLKLHELGLAHSVEIWKNDQLVGGLYGVEVNKVFCGESMFSLVSNASKIALIWLCLNTGYKMIDCQLHTQHLESMGARMISREEYLESLTQS